MAKRHSSDFIDIVGLFRQYLSKWYLFVISVIVCGGLAYFFTTINHPTYAVRANVLITTENQTPSAGDAMGSAMSMLFGSDAYVEDEIFLVSSHSLYREVARDLRLNVQQKVRLGFLNTVLAYPEYPIEITAPAGMYDTLRTAINFKLKVNKEGRADIRAKIKRSTVAELDDVTFPCTVNTPLGEFTFATTEYFVPGEKLTTTIFVNGYDAAAELLDEDVHAEIASKRSNVIALSIDTKNPDFGKAVLNEILEKYNQRGIVEKRKQTARTGDFIESRLVLLADDLAKSDSEVQTFKQSLGILDPYSEGRYQIEKRGEVEAKLIEARTVKEVMDLTEDFLSDPENAYSMVPMLVDSDNMANLIKDYNMVVLERNELLGSARPDNAALQLVTQRLDKMRNNISSSLKRLRNSQSVIVKDLERELGAVEDQMTQMPEYERKFADIYRQNRVKNELYVYLLQRREENSLMMANAQPKGQVIDEAYTLSEPLGMGKKAILLIGLLLGLCLPPLYLYCRKLIHNRFETRQDVERVTDVPILGEMCIDNSGRRLIVSADDTSSAAELFRLMRINLLFVLNNANDKVVLVTSTSSGEGKSYISINLAASLVLMGKKVLSVGMDIRNPRLAEYLEMSPRFGLTQYLSSSQITLDQIINPVPDVPGLDVIVAGPVPPNPAELLISPKVDEMFQTLRDRYDYIIVDTAPIGLVSDTFTLDRVADAAIYVCRANYTSLNDLQLVNDIYEQHRLKKLSIVVNGTAAKKTYGYGQKKHSSKN